MIYSSLSLLFNYQKNLWSERFVFFGEPSDKSKFNEFQSNQSIEPSEAKATQKMQIGTLSQMILKVPNSLPLDRELINQLLLYSNTKLYLHTKNYNPTFDTTNSALPFANLNIMSVSD